MNPPRLYSAIWRWHFYAGLFFAPFLLVFAVTGGIYLFKPQLENLLYRDLYVVPPVARPLSADALVRAAQMKFPGSMPLAYLPPDASHSSALVRMMTAGRQKMTIAVHPANGLVLGAIDDQRRPLQIIRNFHASLLLGKTGQALQELAASWAIILILSGLYLWWPRRGVSLGNRLKDAVFPRLQTAGRMRWRELHRTAGFWISGLLFFLILTGLPWSLVSGDLIHKMASRMGVGAPDTGIGWDGDGSRTVQSMPIQARSIQALSIQPTPVGQGWTATHAQQLAGNPLSTAPSGKKPLPLTRILQIARGLPGVASPYEIRFPVDSRGVYSVVAAPDNRPEATAYVHLDQYTGTVVKAVYWKDFGPMAQAIALGVSLHEGQYFGLLNQLLGLTACLGLIGVIVAGIAMWWRRRPAGSLGAPPLPTDFRPAPVLMGLIVLLALLIPLFGLSLIILVIGERLFRLAARVAGSR